MKKSVEERARKDAEQKMIEKIEKRFGDFNGESEYFIEIGLKDWEELKKEGVKK